MLVPGFTIGMLQVYAYLMRLFFVLDYVPKWFHYDDGCHLQIG